MNIINKLIFLVFHGIRISKNNTPYYIFKIYISQIFCCNDFKGVNVLSVEITNYKCLVFNL